MNLVLKEAFNNEPIYAIFDGKCMNGSSEYVLPPGNEIVLQFDIKLEVDLGFQLEATGTVINSPPPPSSPPSPPSTFKQVNLTGGVCCNSSELSVVNLYANHSHLCYRICSAVGACAAVRVQENDEVLSCGLFAHPSPGCAGDVCASVL